MAEGEACSYQDKGNRAADRADQTSRKSQITYILDILHKFMEIICFPANYCQCNIAYSVVHVQLCFEPFFIYYYTAFLSDTVTAN